MNWQPIETAPKDGEILLFGSAYGGALDYWLGQWCGNHWEDRDGFYLAPTHWMPLPDEPIR
jgi:hypothetical protein